jgi:hypothetical protein
MIEQHDGEADAASQLNLAALVSVVIHRVSGYDKRVME